MTWDDFAFKASVICFLGAALTGSHVVIRTLMEHPRMEPLRRLLRWMLLPDGWVAQWYSSDTNHWSDCIYRSLFPNTSDDGPVTFSEAVYDVQRWRSEEPVILRTVICRVVNHKYSKVVIIP